MRGEKMLKWGRQEKGEEEREKVEERREKVEERREKGEAGRIPHHKYCSHHSCSPLRSLDSHSLLYIWTLGYRRTSTPVPERNKFPYLICNCETRNNRIQLTFETPQVTFNASTQLGHLRLAGPCQALKQLRNCRTIFRTFHLSDDCDTMNFSIKLWL